MADATPLFDARPHVVVIRALLDHAERLISDETGMVVCWHEYTDAQTLDSECVQCCVQHAQDALSDLLLAFKANRGDA